MVKRADIVIGANFGDEGKGLVTDFLSTPETLVVRHNGGAQAGHTVQTPEGRRQVFGHFASGSFVGAKTYLSRFFACNPIMFFKELEKVQENGIDPFVYVDPDCPITTPYDMLINQLTEEFRGRKRHGSVGQGFGETIERSMHSEYDLRFKDLQDENSLRKKLAAIQQSWVSARLKMLGVKDVSEEWQGHFGSEGMFEHFVYDIENFLERVVSAPADLLQKTESIVFEGAQGLLLDQERGFFPHVTRSHTGIKNALTLAQEAGIDTLEVTYITRAYNTRHGAGPLPYELPEKPYEAIEDKTNVHHPYQGSLRFGWLDLDRLASSIQEDMKDASSFPDVKHRLAVTCLDQIDGNHTFIKAGEEKTKNLEEFLSDIQKTTEASSLLTSRGPTRADVTHWNI